MIQIDIFKFWLSIVFTMFLLGCVIIAMALSQNLAVEVVGVCGIQPYTIYGCENQVWKLKEGYGIKRICNITGGWNGEKS
jgi:hypothetical protein